MTRRRLEPNERRKQILDGFIEIAETEGYRSVTREQGADHLGVSPALVTRYFDDNMVKLRAAALEYAGYFGKYKILAQALLLKDPLAADLPEQIKKLAIESIEL